MIKEKLYENIIVPPCMKITLPKSGFTRYLAQSKVGEAYMKSDMNTNFVFIEPFNKKVFKIFSSDEKERNELYEEWKDKSLWKDQPKAEAKKELSFKVEKLLYRLFPSIKRISSFSNISIPFSPTLIT